MFDPKKCITEAMFFEEPDLSKSLKQGDRLLSFGLFCRTTKRDATIYYLDSSNEIKIPGEYLNLFQVLKRRDGEILRKFISSKGLLGFLGLGVELPGMLLSGVDSRGIRDILGKMISLGTFKIREILPGLLRPWELRNTENRIEI